MRVTRPSIASAPGRLGESAARGGDETGSVLVRDTKQTGLATARTMLAVSLSA